MLAVNQKATCCSGRVLNNREISGNQKPVWLYHTLKKDVYVRLTLSFLSFKSPLLPLMESSQFHSGKSRFKLEFRTKLFWLSHVKSLSWAFSSVFPKAPSLAFLSSLKAKNLCLAFQMNFILAICQNTHEIKGLFVDQIDENIWYNGNQINWQCV